MSVNGSNPNGGCPTDCVGVVSGIKRCCCYGTRKITEQIVTEEIHAAFVKKNSMFITNCILIYNRSLE